MVFWITAELLVDGVIENPLHAIPVVNNSVLDWILGKIVAVAKSILSHTIVQILQSLERPVCTFLMNQRRNECKHLFGRQWRWGRRPMACYFQRIQSSSIQEMNRSSICVPCTTVDNNGLIQQAIHSRGELNRCIQKYMRSMRVALEEVEICQKKECDVQ